MGFFGNFFEEYQDDKKLDNFITIFILIAAIFTIGLYVVLPEKRDVLNIYVILMIIAVFGNLIDTLFDRNKFKNDVFASVLAGKSTLVFVGSAVVLFLVGLFLVWNQFSFVQVLAVGGGFYDWLFVAFLSPLWETYFFIGLIFPSFIILLKEASKKFYDVGAIILTCLSFALFHWLAYGANLSSMESAAFFMLVSIVLTYGLKSIGGAFGLHFGVNIGVLLSKGVGL